MIERTISCLFFSEHDKVILQSLISAFGQHEACRWKFVESGQGADVLLIEWDESKIRFTKLRPQYPRALLVAYSARGSDLGDVTAILRKPLRARDMVALLKGLDQKLNHEPSTALDDDIPTLFSFNK